MKEFGDCVGICLHFQTDEEQASEMADEEIEKGSKQKKPVLEKQLIKERNLRDQLRALIFREGICVTDAKQQA